jgi:hypothetical protein
MSCLSWEVSVGFACADTETVRDSNALATILSTFAKQNTHGRELEAVVTMVAQEGQAGL